MILPLAVLLVVLVAAVVMLAFIRSGDGGGIRAALGWTVGLVFVAAAVWAGWNFTRPVEFIVRVEVALNAPGAEFYLGDEYASSDEIRLTEDDVDPAVERFVEAEEEWSTQALGELLPVLYAGETVEPRKSTLGGRALTFRKAIAVTQHYDALFKRGERTLDQLFLIQMDTKVMGRPELARSLRWRIRARRGDACRLELGGATFTGDQLSGALDRWLFRRVVYQLIYQPTVTISRDQESLDRYRATEWWMDRLPARARPVEGR